MAIFFSVIRLHIGEHDKDNILYGLGVQMNSDFVEELSKILVNPTLSIRGSFVVKTGDKDKLNDKIHYNFSLGKFPSFHRKNAYL